MSNFYGGVNQPVKIPRSGSSFHFSYLILLFLGVLISGFGCSPQAAHNIVRDEYPLPEGVEIVPAPESVGEYGGIFIESGGGDPKTFNPLLVEDAGSADAVGKLSSGLVAWDPVRQESVPGLAERWEVSEDNRTFTFYLRKGVLWSDGTPFTADDIEFTFQAIYDPRYPNRNAYDISLDGEPFKVEKIDEYTIRITAPDVFAPFLQKIGVFTLPKHILYEAWKNGTLANEWGLNTAINNPEKLVSLGPYILYSYRPGERMAFIPNPHYYRADTEGKRLPYIDYYITTLSGDSKAAELAFAHGQTDIHGITPDSLGWIEPFAEPQDFTIYDRGPSTTSSFIWFNLNPGTQPDGRPFVDPKKRAWFEDVRFRQAVSYGINREAIIRGVLFGRGTPLYGPESPANTRWYNSNIKTYPYNPERARALLKEAGFHWNRQGQLLDAQNNRVEFTLITNEENALRRQITLIFQQNMEELGIQVQLRFLDFNTLVGRIADSYNYEACLLGLTGGNGDPSGGISVFHSRGRLHQWHPAQESPARDWEAEIDELMIAQLKTLDFEERRKAWFRVQEIMSEQVPYIYLVTPNTYVGIKNRWKNLELPSMGSPIWNLDLWWSISR